MTERIGIDLGGTKIEAVLLDGNSRVAYRHRIATPPNYEGTLAAIASVVATIDGLCPVPAPVGIGTPGAWVESTRTMKNCNSTWLNGQPLLDDLNSLLDGRVRLANDANCFALAEALTGAGRGAEAVFGVILGTGVGGGIVVRGELLAGANAIAGEWGHTPLPYFRMDSRTADVEAALANRHCYCGRVNCVETFLSGPGLAETHATLSGERLPPERIPDDAPSLGLHATMLARALAQIVNVLDPNAIVLGGGVSNLPGLVPAVRAQIAYYGFSHEGRTRVVLAEHGAASGVFGACRLWPAPALRERSWATS